jgi:hypothetical protein
MISAHEVALRIATRLDDDGIAYGIGGALALGALGAPRATKDVDITIFLPEAELPRAFDALERAGLMFDRSAATRDVARIGLFKARSGKMIVDIFLSAHPQYDAMKARRLSIEISGRRLWFISAEDLCLHKLIYGRPKDVIDLERLIAVRPYMDLAYVRSWMTRMIPIGDHRFAVLDDLERRFKAP